MSADGSDHPPIRHTTEENPVQDPEQADGSDPAIANSRHIVLHGPSRFLLREMVTALPPGKRPDIRKADYDATEGINVASVYARDESWVRKWEEWLPTDGAKLVAVYIHDQGSRAILTCEDATMRKAIMADGIKPNSAILSLHGCRRMAIGVPPHLRGRIPVWTRQPDGVPILLGPKGNDGRVRQAKPKETSPPGNLHVQTIRKSREAARIAAAISKDPPGVTFITPEDRSNGHLTAHRDRDQMMGIYAANKQGAPLAAMVQVSLRGELEDWTHRLAARKCSGYGPCMDHQKQRIRIGDWVKAIALIGDGDVTQSWTRDEDQSGSWTLIRPTSSQFAPIRRHNVADAPKMSTEAVESRLASWHGISGSWAVWAAVNKAAEPSATQGTTTLEGQAQEATSTLQALREQQTRANSGQAAENTSSTSPQHALNPPATGGAEESKEDPPESQQSPQERGSPTRAAPAPPQAAPEPVPAPEVTSRRPNQLPTEGAEESKEEPPFLPEQEAHNVEVPPDEETTSEWPHPRTPGEAEESEADAPATFRSPPGQHPWRWLTPSGAAGPERNHPEAAPPPEDQQWLSSRSRKGSPVPSAQQTPTHQRNAAQRRATPGTSHGTATPRTESAGTSSNRWRVLAPTDSDDEPPVEEGEAETNARGITQGEPQAQGPDNPPRDPATGTSEEESRQHQVTPQRTCGHIFLDRYVDALADPELTRKWRTGTASGPASPLRPTGNKPLTIREIRKRIRRIRLERSEGLNITTFLMKPAPAADVKVSAPQRGRTTQGVDIRLVAALDGSHITTWTKNRPADTPDRFIDENRNAEWLLVMGSPNGRTGLRNKSTINLINLETADALQRLKKNGLNPDATVRGAFEKLHVATWNCGGRGTHWSREICKQMIGDIVIVTETNVQTEDSRAAEEHDTEAVDNGVMVHATVGTRAMGRNSGGVSMLIKSHLPAKCIGRAPNIVLTAVYDVLILGIYLPPDSGIPTANRARIRAETMQKASEMIADATEQYPELVHTVIAGDLNTDPRRAMVGGMANNNSSRQRQQQVLTWLQENGVTPPTPDTVVTTFSRGQSSSAIDHVCGSPSMIMTDRKTLPWPASGFHKPLVAQFQLPPDEDRHPHQEPRQVSLRTTILPPRGDPQWEEFEEKVLQIPSLNSAEHLLEAFTREAEATFGATGNRRRAEKLRRADPTAGPVWIGPEDADLWTDGEWAYPEQFLRRETRGKVRAHTNRVQRCSDELQREQARPNHGKTSRRRIAARAREEAERLLRDAVQKEALKQLLSERRINPKKYHQTLKNGLLLANAAKGQFGKWPEQLRIRQRTPPGADMQESARHAARMRITMTQRGSHDGEEYATKRQFATLLASAHLQPQAEGRKLRLTEKELADALLQAAAQMPAGKATGADGFQIAMVQKLTNTTQRRFCEALANSLLQEIRTGKCPRIWRTAIATPVLKPNRDPGNPTNYRPICVASEAARWIFRAIGGILGPYIDSYLPPQQGGFRFERRTTEPAAVLATLIDASPETTAVALDLSSAYDTVDTECLDEILEKLNVEAGLRQFLRESFRAEVWCKVGGALAPVTQARGGVYQGHPLSPMCFNVMLQLVLSAINRPATPGPPTPPGIAHLPLPDWTSAAPKRFHIPDPRWKWNPQMVPAIEHRPAPLLAFADDLLVIGTNPLTAQKTVDMTVMALRAMPGLTLNPRKSKAARLGRGWTQWRGFPGTIFVEHQPITIENELEYLGFLFDRSGTFSTAKETRVQEAQRRINQFLGAAQRWSSTGTLPLPPALRLEVIETYIIPKVTYGLGVIGPEWKAADKLLTDTCKRAAGIPRNRHIHPRMVCMDFGCPDIFHRWLSTTVRWLQEAAEANEQRSFLPALVREHIRRRRQNGPNSRDYSIFAQALLHVSRILDVDTSDPEEVWTAIQRGEVSLDPICHGARRGLLAQCQWQEFLATARLNRKLEDSWAIIHPPSSPIPRRLRPAPYLWRMQAFRLRILLRGGIGPVQVYRQRWLPYEERKCSHCGVVDTLTHHYIFCPAAVRVPIRVASIRQFLLAILGGHGPPLLQQVEPCLLNHP